MIKDVLSILEEKERVAQRIVNAREDGVITTTVYIMFMTECNEIRSMEDVQSIEDQLELYYAEIWED